MRGIGHLRRLLALIALLSFALFLYSLFQILHGTHEEQKMLREWERLLKEVHSHDRISLDRMIHPDRVDEDALGEERQAGREPSASMDDAAFFGSAKRAKTVPLGKLSIPAIKKEWAILKGTGDRQLAEGIGLYPESPGFGAIGNTILAGHREIGFNKLGDLKAGDEIIIQTVAGEFIYKVESKRIVNREDRSVSTASDTSKLTLITCYPFSFFGPAPERYIVTAALAGANGQEE